MPGFGSGSFGSGPFGRWDWSKQVLWKDLPPIDRQVDSSYQDRLFKFSESIQPMFEGLLLKAQDFGSLRDPKTVRTQFNERINLTLVSATLSDGGRTVNVYVENTDPNDPFSPLENTSIGWVLVDADGSQFTVNSVHKMDDLGPMIEIVGRTIPVTEESAGVGNAEAYVRPPGLIRRFGEDFGIEVDTHEPEEFQRSSVRDVTQWLDIKGSARSYDIIGKIAGYRVEAQGLWSLDDVNLTAPPASNVFEIPLGSGNYYTNLNPELPSFDDVAMDTFPMDMFCYETPNWTTDGFLTPVPTPPDGMTVSDALGFGLEDTPIISDTYNGDGTWTIRVGPIDLSRIANYKNWGGEFSSGISGWLETTPVEVLPGEWEFNVIGAASADFGVSVSFSYTCQLFTSCGYCRASVIRVQVTPEEVTSDPDALLDGVLERLVNKILQVVPAHVRLTQIDHVVGPATAQLSLSATGTVVPGIFAIAQLGYYFDITELDEMDLDPEHMIANASIVTIP